MQWHNLLPFFDFRHCRLIRTHSHSAFTAAATSYHSVHVLLLMTSLLWPPNNLSISTSTSLTHTWMLVSESCASSHCLMPWFTTETHWSAEKGNSALNRVWESSDLCSFASCHFKAVLSGCSSTIIISYLAARGLGRGGRPMLGLCLFLLAVCPGPSLGCGPLPKRKCSQAGMDSSTDTQYRVWKKRTKMSPVVDHKTPTHHISLHFQ